MTQKKGVGIFYLFFKHGRTQVIKIIEINSTKFDMFRLEKCYNYIGIQVHISIVELVQLVTIVGDFTIVVPNLVVDVSPNGRGDNGTNIIKEYNFSSNIDDWFGHLRWLVICLFNLGQFELLLWSMMF
jgi:hypothetical protein